MESKLNLTVRTAQRDRQNTISAPIDARIEEILSLAKEKWNLPSEYEYVIKCERLGLGRQLTVSQTLSEAGINPGDILEIQQLAEHGQK